MAARRSLHAAERTPTTTTTMFGARLCARDSADTGDGRATFMGFPFGFLFCAANRAFLFAFYRT
jgi:hypothetical protein